uniref:Uncharacterized protein n=1 Tax=Cannabis sativa TaxID=3483 RepID=A0A803QYL4_CANSA
MEKWPRPINLNSTRFSKFLCLAWNVTSRSWSRLTLLLVRPRWLSTPLPWLSEINRGLSTLRH